MMQFYPGDEVCMVKNGHLAFGNILQKDNQSWKVDWNDGNEKEIVDGWKLTLTDRPIQIGCKVKKAVDDGENLVGICRNISEFADVRLVGTNTMLCNINMSEFTHLKEFKQKSVVFMKGWLGVITDVERSATVVLTDKTIVTRQYSHILGPANPLKLEFPWINEPIKGAGCMTATPIAVKCNEPALKNPADLFDAEVIAPDNGLVNSKSTPKLHYVPYAAPKFLKDLRVDKLKVVWRYQVDLMSPDPPTQEFKGSRMSQLKLVTEDTGTDTSFQMGNLGRYTLRTDHELLSFQNYEKDFVKRHIPSQISLLSRGCPYPDRAYLSNPEEVATPEQSQVVEIVHLCRTADVMWQDGTGRMDFVPSLNLINVMDNRMLISVVNAMDFVYSPKIGFPVEMAFCIVQHVDLANKTVQLKVLTTENPPKELKCANYTFNEADVYPHPKYRHFNETNSIVAWHEDQRLRIGHVQRTNFMGKIQVRWIDSGGEEWCWPTAVSLYIQRGFDLECIISLINDADEVQSSALVKLCQVLDKLRSEKLVWESFWIHSNGKLVKSIESLKFILDAFLNLEPTASHKGIFFPKNQFDCDFSSRLSSLSGNKELDYHKPGMASFMQAFCKDLEESGMKLLHFIQSQEKELMETSEDGVASLFSEPADEVAMDVDQNLDSGIQETSAVASLSLIFDSPVETEDSVPENHTYYAYNFEPEQYVVFLRIIRNELTNFYESRAPGIKVRAYGDRLDLFSIAIHGPAQTPYENSLYLFDSCLPAKYPAIPPKVNFLTYGGGRLNPNLYECGKVCLSLLGTWPGRDKGECWTKDSNLLQILISIQGLILVGEPYHNEPGLEAEYYSPEERKFHRRTYNTQLMPKICNMMYNQLENAGKPWGDDIRTFYIENIPKFTGRWRKWLAAAAVKPTTTEMEFLSELNEDEQPGFEIYPFDNAFTKTMKIWIQKLETKLKEILEMRAAFLAKNV